MPKRPRSSPVHLHPHQRPHKPPIPSDSDTESTAVPQRRSQNENRTSTPEPPLPRTWLETVARAVLFGGAGAYIGGPSSPPTSNAMVTTGPTSVSASPLSGVSPFRKDQRTLRPSRSSISQVTVAGQHPYRPGLMDRTNADEGGRKRQGGEKGLTLAPPELFVKLERGRAVMSVGEVTHTRVVCRSAPVSRASSPGGEGGKERRKGQGHKKGRGREQQAKGRSKKGGRQEEKDRMPILANTNVEGDAWDRDRDKNRARGKGVERPGKNRYLTGWGADVQSSEESSSEEEEGELDLARMLVPPKRQNSIKSLRKHLTAVVHEGPLIGGMVTQLSSRVRGVSVGNRPTAAAVGRERRNPRQSALEGEDWFGNEEEEWGRGWVRRGMRRVDSVDDDDEASYAVGLLSGGRDERGMVGSGRSTGGKTRSGLPGPWAFIGGGGS